GAISDMLCVLKSSGGGPGGDHVDTSFESSGRQSARRCRSRDSVTDSQTGKAEDLGKAAHDDHTRIVDGTIDERHVIRRLFYVMMVRLIDHDVHRLWKGGKKRFEILPTRKAPSGIVRIADVCEACRRVALFEHGVQIVSMGLGQRDGDD